MSKFSIEEILVIPQSLAEAHNSKPTQSINVLNTNCSDENRLIRLFLGTVFIRHEDSGQYWRQSINYSVLGCPSSEKIKSSLGLKKLLSAYDISIRDLDKHLRATLAQQSYYGDLLYEICNYFWRTRKGEHTLAFLHLYRFLEHISFAFPLLYASRTKNFSNAFGSLKEYFLGEAKGELGFFRKFLTTSMEEEILEQSATINFENINILYRAEIYSAIKRQAKDSISSESTDRELKIKNSGMIDLCINLRNRYFHFTTTNNENISIKKIGDSDLMFACVNQAILNFLTVLYFETLKHRIGIA